MKATEFIRGLLDLIDSAQEPEQNVTDYEEENMEQGCGCGPDCDCPECREKDGYSNSPGEQYTSTDTIMSMGNDLNQPKHPADIRVSTVALYPESAYKGR